jgi:hypothetical protein
MLRRTLRPLSFGRALWLHRTVGLGKTLWLRRTLALLRKQTPQRQIINHYREHILPTGRAGATFLNLLDIILHRIKPLPQTVVFQVQELKGHVEVLDKVTDGKRTFVKPICNRVDGQARLSC